MQANPEISWFLSLQLAWLRATSHPVAIPTTIATTGSEFEAPPGSFVFIPRGTAHTWQNVGATLARLFAAMIPASPEFEQFFVRYAELPPRERGVAAFVRLADETQGAKVVGPPLAQTSRPRSNVTM